MINNGRCDAVKEALLDGPVVAGIAAGVPFQSYKSGTILEDLETKEINHDVLLVGYTKDFWVIRNSWGPSFGENGYYKIAMGNHLRICDDVAIPTRHSKYDNFWN
mmetsp:Transcript_65150/g.90636  ORF Transcript_65150/g.90636 Transcript_65150/m.90636 type:complete len:105 (-) Transcript_65150:499-813(-)